MSELYQRLARYKKERNIRRIKQEKSFIRDIKEGGYPSRCFSCFSLGIRWCKYWGTGFNCDEYEIGNIEELSRRFDI